MRLGFHVGFRGLVSAKCGGSITISGRLFFQTAWGVDVDDDEVHKRFG